jgi:hypothetical protein
LSKSYSDCDKSIHIYPHHHINVIPAKAGIHSISKDPGYRIKPGMTAKGVDPIGTHLFPVQEYL